MEWEDLSVHLSSAWALQCSPQFHKASPSRHGFLGTMINHLPGRPSDYASAMERLAAPGGVGNTTDGVLRFCHQQVNIPAETFPTDTVLGVPSRLQEDEILPSRGENAEHNADLSGGSDSGQIINPTVIITAGQQARQYCHPRSITVSCNS